MEKSDVSDMVYPSLKRDADGNLTEIVLEPVKSEENFAEDAYEPAETERPPENIPTERTGVRHFTL